MAQPNKREVRQIKAKELRVATNDKGQRVLTGYAAVFNSLSCDMGGWFEIVSTSAFTRTLQENPDVLCLYSHDASLVLGRTKSSTLTLTIDQTGLKFEVILPDTTTANDLIVSIERGDVDGCSFGFVCQNDVWAEDAEYNIVRTLLDVDLFEITITACPAYAATSVSLRSAPKEIRSKLSKRDDDGDGEGDGVEMDSKPACSCSCSQCAAGSHSICSADPKCEHRDDDSMETDSRSIRNYMEMRLALAAHRLT
jgi:HK97 family phage prohead protease